MLTIDYGETKLQSQINWIDKVIEQIEDREYDDPELMKKYRREKEEDHEK
jgi:hypothetical protein